MPIQGPQQPGFWLPDTEYFSLSPNTNIALQGRRRRPFTGPTTAAPPTTDSNNALMSVTLENPFLDTSAIYLHFFQLQIGTNIPVTVNNVIAGLNLLNSTNSPDYPLGQPIFTTPQANISTVLLSDRDKLICAKDVHAADVAAGGTGQTQLLNLVAILNIANTEASTANFFIFGCIIYTRLDGLLE